jgi:tRNA(Ile)-lysidine synthase
MSNKPSLTVAVNRFIENNRLFGPGSRIIVGVSGGPDSMALFSILNELRRAWDLDLSALYCHHGLRQAADREADFVRTWAGLWGCAFSTSKVDVQAFQQENKLSLQEAARELRYRVFRSFLVIQKADHVALAHTANDQAEEVLIGLIRGAGLGGLAGIPLQREGYIRPLLATYRLEILAYLAERNIPYLEDESNRDRRFLRARVRHQLLPELEKFSPKIITQLNRTSDLLRKDEAFLQEKTERIMAQVGEPLEAGVQFSRKRLKKIPPAILSRLFQKALFQVKGDLRSIGSAHLLSLVNAVCGPAIQGRLDLPGGVQASWDRDRIILRPVFSVPPPPNPFSRQVDGPGTITILEIGAEISFEKVGIDPRTVKKSGDKQQVLVDWEKIQWPLLVRNVQAGDRFQPLGLRGSKKVNRFFMDRKIARSRREQIPILISGGEIVWIVGLEIGDRFALSDQSQQALRLKFQKA